MEINTHFDPTWRDDVFDRQALDMAIVMPRATPRNQRIWVDQRLVRQELIFEQPHHYESYRSVTSILKPSDMVQYYKTTDGRGNVLSADDPALNYIFPPKAVMGDTGEERCTMFAAAKVAQGRVLVGGLGLAVYPQMVLALNPAVESLTIIERDEEIINLVAAHWLNAQPDLAKKCTIVHNTIETYLANSDELFDTIYLDTWEDADPRFLAHVNYLIALAARRCSPNGKIQCWGYARMIDTFTESMHLMTKNNFPWHEHHLDPVLAAFVAWLDSQGKDVTEEAITAATRMFATTIQKPIEEYDRHRCFTAFGTSLADAYRNMALSRK